MCLAFKIETFRFIASYYWYNFDSSLFTYWKFMIEDKLMHWDEIKLNLHLDNADKIIDFCQYALAFYHKCNRYIHYFSLHLIHNTISIPSVKIHIQYCPATKDLFVFSLILYWFLLWTLCHLMIMWPRL